MDFGIHELLLDGGAALKFSTGGPERESVRKKMGHIIGVALDIEMHRCRSAASDCLCTVLGVELKSVFRLDNG